MSNCLHCRISGTILLLVLLINAVFATPALADGGAPASPSGTTAATTAVSSSLPAGTNVVVLDYQGHKVPLGSQKAAEIMGASDPVWCPASVAVPTPGSGGCSPANVGATPVNDNLYDLIHAIGTGVWTPLAANSTIWMENGSMPDSSSLPVTIDGGASFSSWANFTLTIKGGWNAGTGTINTSLPSQLSRPLTISNWNNNVTLSDIVISNTGGNGLTISTTKNITLTRVQTSSNAGYGADLNNCKWTGSACAGAGNVVVTSSLFKGNSGTGLSVLSSGTITLTNAIALNNSAGDGVDLDNCKSNGTICQIVSPKAISVTGDTLYNSTANAFNNSFNGNGGYGLSVISNGAVTLKDLTAAGNAVFGAKVDNSGSSAASAVTLNGTNIFNGNTSTGLNVVSKGAITASHIVANANGGAGNQDGANLDNSNAATPLNVTISGSSQFNGNGDSGLVVNSKGAITLNNITANSNRNGNGASLRNNFNPLVHSAVTLTGTNFFNNNYDNINFLFTGGLIISTNGAVKLSNITANGNTGGTTYNGWGALIRNDSSVTAQSVTLTGVNTFNDDSGDGLQIYSSGPIAASSLTANNNLQNGAVFVGNNTGITLTLNNFFENNGYDGLYAISGGNIAVNNLTAVGNGGSALGIGVYLDNGATGKTVTLNGVNLFDSNYADGLDIVSTGAVTLNNITATNNGVSGGFGANISAAALTIKGTNVFSGNYSGGLYVNASGAITVNSLTANNNSHGYGALLNNTANNMPNVTLTGSNVFNGNQLYGLQVNTYGMISVSNLTAIGNTTGDGVDLLNFANPAPTPKTVIVGGSNTFADNGVNGLVIASLGAITANNITAYVSPTGTSTGNSVSLSNAMTGAVGGVTLTGANVFNDYQSSPTNQNGLLINSRGAVSLSNVTASGNGSMGASIDNSAASLPQTVKLTGVNIFNSNHSAGLFVNSIGAVAISNLQANNTTNGDGADLNTSTGGSTASVTLLGASVFQGNYINGLYIQSSGAVVTNGITANENGIVGLSGKGVYIDNTFASTPQNVSILGTANVFNDNYSAGMYVKSKGAIAAANITANNDVNGNGVTLDNSGSGASGGVSLTGANTFYNNHADGLQAASRGAITISRLDAERNLADGANFDNSLGSSVNVSLTGLSLFENNGGNGLYIASGGSLSLTKIHSDNNIGDGLNIASAANATLTCGGFTGNDADGINATIPGTLLLSGVLSYGNTGTQIALSGGGTLVNTVRDCPLP
jgi:hypothetical protein